MWTGFNTLFFGSSVNFLNEYFSQINIRDQDLSEAWVECQATEPTQRTLVVGRVLEEANNALFQEYGHQLCTNTSHDHNHSQTVGMQHHH